MIRVVIPVMYKTLGIAFELVTVCSTLSATVGIVAATYYETRGSYSYLEQAKVFRSPVHFAFRVIAHVVLAVESARQMYHGPLAMEAFLSGLFMVGFPAFLCHKPKCDIRHPPYLNEIKEYYIPGT